MLHLKSLEPPEPSLVPGAPNDVLPQENTSPTPQPPATSTPDPTPIPEDTKDAPVRIEVQDGHNWSEEYTAVLDKFLSRQVIEKLRKMYEEGPEPPFVSDAGWGSRQARQEESEIVEETPVPTTSKRGRGRGRGGRGGRGGNRSLRAGRREDTRRVVTEVCTSYPRIHVAEQGAQPIADKALRTELHKAIRQLFKGSLDSEADTAPANDDDGLRISIKWVSGDSRGGKNPGKGMSPSLVSL